MKFCRLFQNIFLIGSFIPLYGQVSVTASVSHNTVSKSETFSFKIVALNANESPSVDVSPLGSNFKVISGPAQQTNIQWVNGSMTSSRSLSWTLLALQSGRLNIPSLNVRVGSQVYKTNPIGITVEKGLGRAQVANLFIEAKPDKEQIHLGEQVTVTYRLFTRTNLSVESIEYPKTVGFWSEDLLPARTARFNNTQINGVNYKVATLYKSAMFPTQTGKLKVTPMTAICNVEVSQRRRRGVFDDPFFNSMFQETQRKFIESDTLEITVMPYPKSPPADFTGAVGQFSIESWLDTSTVSINEAITLHVSLEGTGNLNQFKLSPFSFPQNMEVFPPTASFQRDEFRDQLTGQQKFEYILIPRQSGSFVINPMVLTYFDPVIDEFKTIKTKPMTLEVNQSMQGTYQPKLSGKENVNIIANDIRFIKTDTKIKLKSNPSSISLWILSPYVLAMSIFLLPSVTGRMSHRRASSLDLRNNKGALKVALKDIKKEISDPYSDSSMVLYGYIKAKLYLNTNKLDPLILEQNLKNKLSTELLNRVVLLAKICDAGRFSPESSQLKDDIKVEITNLLKDLDRSL